ncbi:DUF31 family putative serine protease [Mycoplasma sp. 'Moose RK']|uniref:DUF31 family putative serine protease n=1 Tax=Mycoplasma sp. 'Moose RK' TaxID=2780095 RepID=UPI00280A5D6F|nr:hypothetical protein [Mycoplasma sp. 'Moose RK']
MFKKIFLRGIPALFAPGLVVSCTWLGAAEKLRETLQIGSKNPWDQQLNLRKPLDSVVAGRVRQISSTVKATEFLQKIAILNPEGKPDQSIGRKNANRQETFLNNSIIWTFIPGVDNFDLIGKFDLKVTPIFDSANDFYGSVKVKVDAFDKDSKEFIQSKIFVITGFETTQTGIYAYKDRIATAFASIKNLTLKDGNQNLDLQQIGTKNIWDFVNLPSNFEKMDFQKLNNFDQFDVPDRDSSAPSLANIAKNPYRLKVKPFYYIKGTILGNSYDKSTNEIDVILSIYHDSFQNFISKIVKLKINPSSTQGLEKLTEAKSFKLRENYSNFLPSFLTNPSYNNEFLQKYIDFSGLNHKNFDIKVVSSLSNDQTGDLFVILNSKEKNLLFGAYSPGQIIKVEGFNSYEKIFAKKEFRDQINFEYLDNWYKLSSDSTVAQKLKNITDSLNSSSDSLLWPLFGEAIQKTMTDETLFRNTEELKKFDKLNYQFASLVNFNVDKTGVSFYFSNWVQDFYKIFVPFDEKAPTKNIVADFGQRVFENEIINDGLRARSIVIRLRSNAFDSKTQSNTTKITSGTAWVFDRKLKVDPKNPGKFLPTNTYYLATNLHVVADLINNPEQIYSFSYLLDGNIKNLDAISFDNNNLFRRFDRISKTESNKDFLPPEGFQYITPEAKQFWKDLKVNPIGLNSPENGKFRDIAIIEITFPNDKKIDNPFNLGIPFLDFEDPFGLSTSIVKNIPDAIRYYNENPLDFLVTNKLLPSFTKISNKIDARENEKILPLHAYLGGFLGGYSWESDDKNSFITTEKIVKQNKFKNNSEIRDFNGADGISLPGLRGGHGMSGSLVVNEYNQVLGIFWGGYFPPTTQGLVKGVGQFDPIGIKIDKNPTILAKWLAQTQNIETDLDAVSKKVFDLENPVEIEKMAHSAKWIKFNQNSQNVFEDI